MAIKIRKSILAAVAVGSGLAFASTGMATEAGAASHPSPMLAALQPYPPAPIDCPEGGDVNVCANIVNNNVNENDNEADADAIAVSQSEQEAFDNALTSDDPNLAPLGDFSDIQSFPSAHELDGATGIVKPGPLNHEGDDEDGDDSDGDDGDDSDGTSEDSSSTQDKHFTIDIGDEDGKEFDDDFGHGWFDEGECFEEHCEKVVKKELPMTGTSSVSTLAGAGTGLLLAGAAGTLIAMRRRRSTDAK
ncbi:LPXTG cell wall anchor domain-containing protein [Nonomuraea indica]|uniref:LPXTG cell wall anchor domain-containing protein n=1 Tax=Nonomuraea indica TaxID=1581193 RepID=A0ABW8ABC9_9ACTN